MSLHYVDRFDGTAITDDVGIELPDPHAMRDYVKVLYQWPKMLTHRAIEPSRIFDAKPKA